MQQQNVCIDSTQFVNKWQDKHAVLQISNIFQSDVLLHHMKQEH